MRNKKAKRSLVVIGISFALFFSVGGHFIQKYWHEYLEKQPKMYVYETYRGDSRPVSVLLLKNKSLKSAYLDYYQKLESGIEPILDYRIPLKTLPQYNPVYVLKYSKDSTLVKVVSIYNGDFGSSYCQGWVYAKTLHEKPFEKKD